MEDNKSILHELYVFSEWKPEPEYLQKPDNILPENISVLWRWLKFFGPKKSLIDSITAFKERQQKWQIALGDEGKVIAVLTDNILEIRTKRSEYATIAARTTVNRDAYPQWRKLVWSPDCSFVVLAYGNGIISFFDLTASNLFNIPTDCTRPGGLECTDNTHAVADIIFMPLRVKDNKWNWEVLVVTYDGKLRGYLVSQTDGYKLHHSFRFSHAVAAMTYCESHATLYVCGVPHVACKDPSSPLSAGITAWRILNDEPWYKLSVVSDELETLATERFHLYIPFVSNKNLAFVVHMVLSPDGSKLVCLHCNGDVSVWRLPLLKLLHRWPLAMQPQHQLDNPLVKAEPWSKGKDATKYYGADVNWWSNEEIILSRFSGAVSICDIENMVNILGQKPEFFQGSPRVTCAHDGTFMVLECESNILPAKRNRSDDSMEVVKVEVDSDDTMLELTKELFKTVLYAITDIETFQPKPKKITVVSRIYRLLGVKSTTPNELFSRKIESGHYTEALTLADTFSLDSDLVYQQQWRKNPVSTDAIQKYLSKVSKKIWAVHQCVDRLPETLPAAKELLQFGLELTNERILSEINKDRPDDPIENPEDIVLEDLNAYTSELLRCRHVMLFYKERLRLYEAILRCEKSTYQKDEYDRLRSNSIVYSSMEIAKEGRIEALTCLWPNIKTAAMQLAVLEKLPETIYPVDYQHLLPMKLLQPWFQQATRAAPEMKPPEVEHDWCRNEIFRPIWSSNWSEDTTPEAEQAADISATEDIAKWYERRAREIERRSGLVSNSLTLITIAMVGGAVEGLDDIMYHLLTLDTLIYDINVEGVTLEMLEKMSVLDTCKLLMKMSTPTTFVADLKQFVIPLLKRYENLTQTTDACLTGLTNYLESISVDDLSYILLVLKSPSEFELDVRTHLELAERCLFAYTGTEQLDMACDLLDTILKESDGSISGSELVRRVKEIERLVSASSRVSWRGVRVPPRDLSEMRKDPKHAHNLLTRVARSLSTGDEKPNQQDWEKLLKDILELQETLFFCVPKEQCYEIYASSLLTSGDAASIRLASEVLTCVADLRRSNHLVNYQRSVELVSNAAKEYFNSASSLGDPALELAKACLSLIKDGNPEIQQELDLISALQILNAFDLGVLPIQVRICEDRMSLIEKCLQLDPNAYLAGHKLLKLAKLLRIAGDDEQTREGQVLQLVGEYALRAGPQGSAAAADAARRLAALRYAPAATLLSHVATVAHAHADRGTRRELYAAAAATCMADKLENILCARLCLELEGLYHIGAAAQEQTHSSQASVARWPSTDDEFADAITTPIIEKKDLVAPPKADKKPVPLFNYLLETIQSKFASSDKSSTTECEDKSVHCQEFYRSLYAEHLVTGCHYRYDTFSIPHMDDHQARRGQALLSWFYILNSIGIDSESNREMEAEVVQKCAEEMIYKDTPLGVSCLLRSCQDFTQTRRLIESHNTETLVGATLYATLMKCNAPELRDNVYLSTPSKLARTTLKQKNASEEQLEIIRQCIAKLSAVGEVDRLKRQGFNVNGLLFNADEDYRKETIFRVARSPTKEHLDLACSLAAKYKMDALEVWMQHAESDPTLAHLTIDTIPHVDNDTHARLREGLWPQISGSNHNALINYFTLLRNVDDKPVISGLTAAEHIKLLKKAKAASQELDYKLLLEQPSVEDFSAHILAIIRPENVGILTKLLRSLPPAFRVPVSVNEIYTMWLTKYFFSLPSTSANNKKWMQQYRQCASYFNKLGKGDLLQFLNNTCFTVEAIQRVPPGTRSLMIMQAVDYCQQEQENEFKFNKNELTWAGVGQELTRWARFLDNYHSSTVQCVIDTIAVRHDVWLDIEMSHGDADKIVSCLSQLLLEGDLRLPAMSTLLQCLHVSATPERVFEHTVDAGISSTQDVETLVTRLTQYHKDGVRFTDDLIDRVMQLATDYNLPPHKQISLLSLSQRERVQDSGDLLKIAQFTVDLFKTEWPELEYAQALTDEKLTSDSGRREVLSKFMELSDTWQRKKALIDVLICWPPTKEGGKQSLHCDYLCSLLTSADQKESLVLIKLLLTRPILDEEEVTVLTKNVSADAVLNAIWIILLNKCEQNKEDIVKLVQLHKETILKHDIEEDLIKELLDSGMFLKLVSTPLYSVIISYVIQQDSSNGEPNLNYTTQWAVDQLIRANYLAEAGNLRLLALGVPAALRGFSQSVLYAKNSH